MEREKIGLCLHAITVHFTVALFPVALFFLLLYLFFHLDTFRHTYISLMILASISIPFSYVTGIIVWSQVYGGARTRIFIHKIWCGLALPLVGFTCVLWYCLNPQVMDSGGLHCIGFTVLNFTTLLITIYLGHLGGKLTFKVHH